MFYAFLTLAILASIMSVRVLVMLIRTSKSEERKRYALALVIGVPTVVFCYWRVLSWESADSSISDLVEKRQQELEKERKELEEMKKRLESFVGTEEEESTEEIDFEPAPRANGEQHGISKEFVVRDGKKILIRETPWVKGEVQGIEKNYYRHTGKLRYKMAWVHGRHEGEDKKYY
ncbi:MAG: hypothetical protein KGZ25_15765, partial [Planctomycetes bacterium]|nr:hypothetical protein [Planctomycetota bacterium]